MSIPDEDNYQINEKKPFQLQSGMDSDESVNQPQESSSDSDEGRNWDLEKINFEDFNLRQYEMITGLNIQIENPVVVLKDRPYNTDTSIRMDLGLIHITSKLEKNFGRWVNFPEKEVLLNVMTIDTENVHIDYKKSGQNNIVITPNFDMRIELEKVNYTDLLADDFLSKGIDFK